MSLPTFPDASGIVMLDGPVGTLELAVDFPEGETAALPLVAVVCHPLSTEGGSLQNKVVTMTARGLRDLGATTVRPNFRSVGKSTGSFDHGLGETEDLLAVVAWVRAQRPEATLWLAGFSFGAYVALRAYAQAQPDVLISIAPPVGRERWDFESLVLPQRHWLVIQGDADEVVDPQAVYDWIGTLTSQPELARMPEASHFFHGKLIDLRGALQHSVRNWLPAA